MTNHKVVLEEHERLDVLVRDLRMVSGWDPKLLANEQVRMRLARDLGVLKSRLLEHFTTEESGSYMQELCSRDAAASKLLADLQSEHSGFLEQIGLMETACVSDEPRTEAYGILLRTLSRFLDHLKLHEERENALIKKIFQS